MIALCIVQRNKVYFVFIFQNMLIVDVPMSHSDVACVNTVPSLFSNPGRVPPLNETTATYKSSQSQSQSIQGFMTKATFNKCTININLKPE